MKSFGFELNHNYVKGVKLEIENSEFIAAENNIKTCIKAGDGDIEKTLIAVKKYLPSFKAGRGGSHIWISQQNNDRIAIIRFNK